MGRHCIHGFDKNYSLSLATSRDPQHYIAATQVNGKCFVQVKDEQCVVKAEI